MASVFVGRSVVGSALALVGASLVAVWSLAGPAEALPAECTAAGGTVSCTYTSDATFTVPADVSSITILAVGGNGASPAHGGSRGKGAAVTSTFSVGGTSPVVAGETLTLDVGGNASGSTGGAGGGGNGGPGPNYDPFASSNGGGGGGGATEVSGTPGPSQRLVVAGGGGGGGFPGTTATTTVPAGDGGNASNTADLSGGNGTDANGDVEGAEGGGGGHNTAGGAAGAYQSGAGGDGSVTGAAGNGGHGADLGDGSYTYAGGGGGGAGYTGGGGGGGGGGGSGGFGGGGGGAAGLSFTQGTSLTVAASEGTPLVTITYSVGFTTGPTATITGTPQQGQTLTAHEGSPDPTPDSFSYKWFADGAEIAGQTAKTLLLGSAQVGKKISVEVTAHKSGLVDASDTSPQTSPVVGIFNPGPHASISGTQRVGSTLTAGTGSPSPTPTSYAYQWYVDGHPITGANAKTFFLGASFAGKQLQVRVYAIKAGYVTASSLSPLTSHISNLQAKTISLELNDYTVKRGQRVYANLDRLAAHEAWSIVLDGKKLASGTADSTGYAKTSFVIPTNATLGTRTIYGYGAFPDRVDPDTITVR